MSVCILLSLNSMYYQLSVCIDMCYHIFILGDVGGVMGLLLGASVLTIGELLDLIIYSICRHMKHKRAVKADTCENNHDRDTELSHI